MPSFIPANGSAEDVTIVNDGWYPDLSVQACRDRTGLGDEIGAPRVEAVIREALIEIGLSIATWRAEQTAPTLAEVSTERLGDIPVKVWLYETAVYARARAILIDQVRDYDATKSGHDRADALTPTAQSWLQRSAEALARLTGRSRTTVELI